MIPKKLDISLEPILLTRFRSPLTTSRKSPQFADVNGEIFFYPIDVLFRLLGDLV